MRLLVTCLALLGTSVGASGQDVDLHGELQRLREIHRTAPESSQSYALAALYLRLGRADVALETLEPLVRDPAFAPWALYLRGQALVQDDPGAALAAYRRALRVASASNAPAGADAIANAAPAAIEFAEEELSRRADVESRSRSLSFWIAGVLLLFGLLCAALAWTTRPLRSSTVRQAIES